MSSLLLLISVFLVSNGAALLSHADPAAALDASIDPRQKPGVEFYMVSAIALGDDGAASSSFSSSCPKFVGLLEPFELNYSLPVKFRPAPAADPGASSYVELSENYVVEFSGGPPCMDSPAWTVTPPDSDGSVYLMAGEAQQPWNEPPPPPPPAQPSNEPPPPPPPAQPSKEPPPPPPPAQPWKEPPPPPPQPRKEPPPPPPPAQPENSPPPPAPAGLASSVSAVMWQAVVCCVLDLIMYNYY